MIGTVTLLLSNLLGGVAPADEAARKELAALEGTWILQSLQFDGKDLTGDYKLSLVIKGETATVEGNDEVKMEYTRIGLKLDPSTMPKCLDLRVVGGTQKDSVLEGIYELKGDELKLCVKVLGKDRPGKFESPDGESIALVTFKRQK